ncbi:MAG: deoxyguanosinetriphosphate triphosphohydrolase [Pseudomonadota bacterium]
MVELLNWREDLALWATDARRSQGRLIDEPPSRTRTPFQRDRDRIIHSTAFRRLKHKTQVFVSHEGDHYRTRLTHSIEVSQIARSIARSLRLDEDLAEALALVHDFGHTPFGHAGERALEAKMRGHGGFEHNAQALRIVTELETPYPDFDGMNLTWETLEGLIKHNGPLSGPHARQGHPVPAFISQYNGNHDLKLDSFASLEAQAAAISDDIAYNSADIDDGLRAGLFSMADLSDVPFVSRLISDAGSCDPTRLGAYVTRRVITELVEDAIFTSQDRLQALRIGDVEDARGAGQQLIDFSSSITDDLNGLRTFLFERMYRHERVMAVMSPAEDLVGRLFDRYLEDPTEIPAPKGGRSSNTLHRRVCDHIAGMTDDFALREAARLFDDKPSLG